MKRFLLCMSISVFTFSSLVCAKNYDISQIDQVKLITEYSDDTRIEDIDTVTYGSYYQSNGSNKEAIEWIVLDRKEDSALLLSKYILDKQKFDDDINNYDKSTWEISSIRKWLNSKFLNNAFNDNEKSYIKPTTVINNDTDYVEYSGSEINNIHTDCGNDTIDKLFLLSIDEVKLYFGEKTDFSVLSNGSYYESDRVYKLGTKRTNYARGDGSVIWWLRSMGRSHHQPAHVSGGNIFSYAGVSGYFDKEGVRPAMWVSINALKRVASLNSQSNNNSVNNSTNENQSNTKQYADVDLNTDNVIDVEKYGKDISEFDEDTQKWIYEHAEKIDTSGNNVNKNNQSNDGGIGNTGSATSNIPIAKAGDLVKFYMKLTLPDGTIHEDGFGEYILEAHNFIGDVLIGRKLGDTIVGPAVFGDNRGSVLSNVTVDVVFKVLGINGVYVDDQNANQQNSKAITGLPSSESVLKGGGVIAGLPSREAELRSDNHFYIDNKLQRDTWVYYQTYYYHVGVRGDIHKSRWIELRYVGEDGRMYRGRQTPDGKWVGDDGLVIDIHQDLYNSMIVNPPEPDSWWKSKEGIWYYFENDRNTTKKGWFTDARDNQTYYLNPETGAMAVGWTNIGSGRYYFNESHDNEPNWYAIGGGFYESYNKKVKSYGSMFRNEQTPDGQYVDANGRLIN